MLEKPNALATLRAFIDQNSFPLNSRLPSERALCEKLGLNRSVLRKALDALEREGLIWRHVGKGTFAGARPIENLEDVSSVINRSSPAKVMEARLLLEPELARLAAVNATLDDHSEMEYCIDRTKAAREWRQYELWDNRFHRSVARATHNVLLLFLFDSMNFVRRAVAWGRLRSHDLGRDLSHHSFSEHDQLFEAIKARDRELASQLMREHLATVRDRLLNPLAKTG